MQKHRSITLERFDKFISKDFFQDVNLYSSLFDVKSDFGLQLWSFPVPEALGRIPFEDAVRIAEWKHCKVGDEFGPSWATVWFKLHIQVPREFAGKPVQLLFDNSAEALVYSQDGKPLSGLTGGAGHDRHVDFTLFQTAKGGEVTTLYIEGANNGMFGCGDGINPPQMDRKYKLAQCELAAPNPVAFGLYYDFQIISSLAKELPADSQGSADALYTANQICNVWRKDDPKTWKRCRGIAKEFLSKYPSNSDHEVFAIGHCHIDTAWLWPYDETKRKAARSWSLQLSLMEKYPQFKFCCSQAQQYLWIQQTHPTLYERIKEYVQKGQFVPIGGTWVEMDCNVPSGESFVRQFMYGQRFFEKEFGKRHEVFWLPDTFGYSSQLPAIAKSAGIKYFFTQKLSWNNINKFPHTTFYWAGLDGTKLLTHFSPADTYCAQATVKELLGCVTNHKDKPYSSKSLLVFGNGDGGGGPLEPMIERLNRTQNCRHLPKTKFGDPNEFFSALEREARDLVTWHGELYFELHRGTYTTHGKVKRSNRMCELLLRDVEMLGALVGVTTSKVELYPQKELERCWQNVLLNQFHDVLPGSSIEMVYDDAHKIYEEVLATADKLKQDLLAKFLLSLPLKTSPNPPHVAVVNTTSYTRPYAIVEVDDVNQTSLQRTSSGSSLIVVEDVPSCGVGVYDLAEKPLKSNIGIIESKDGSVKVENSLVLAEFDRHGRLASLYDKRCCRETVAPGKLMNVFQMYEDIPLFWDAWDIEVYHLEKHWDLHQLGLLKVIERGPIRVVLEVTHQISGSSTITQRIIMNAMDSMVEFDCTVNWNENRKCLKVEFPCGISNDYATYETQFGVVRRPTHYNTSWDLARFEVCGHKFVDYSEYGYGVALLNDCKYGMAVHEDTIRLTLLRAPKAPDAHCDIGLHSFRFGVYPHQGSFLESDVVAKGIHFNVQPLRRFVKALKESKRSFFKVSDTNLVLDTIKLPEPALDESTSQSSKSDEVILRLYEAYGGRGVTTITSDVWEFAEAQAVNILEEPLSLNGENVKSKVNLDKSSQGIRVEYGPFELVTIRVKVKNTLTAGA